MRPTTPAATLRPAARTAFFTGFFSDGFRPFFLFGALQAALMIAVWVPWFLGFLEVPTTMSPITWHQHELLFGFVPATIAGFLLTAVPNWTGRKGLSGTPLFLLFLLWLAGRLAVWFSADLGAVAGINLLFLPVLALYVLRELVAARNSRNYKIVIVLAALSLAQLLFHYEAMEYGMVRTADRLTIATIILLVTIVGGRIIPVFTANWLRNNNPGPLPPSFNRADQAVMAVSLLALAGWVSGAAFEPFARPAGILLLVAGLAQFARQLRWRPLQTRREPLLAILHVAFVFVPLGFFLSGAALLTDDTGLRSAGIHAWTSGAIGAMTLAVMARATRGHSGHALHAPASTVLWIYLPIIVAALARIAAAIWPELNMVLLSVAGLCWICAFLGYAGLYGRMLLIKR